MSDLSLSTNVMSGIDRPATLQLVSQSAPQSRVTTPPPVGKYRRASFSHPVSPIAKNKPLSPIVRDLISSLSPTRAIRKRAPRVTFNQFNPRAQQSMPSCPIHAYSSVEQEIAVLPTRAVGGVKFSTMPRSVEAELPCPVHAYSTIEQEIAVLPTRAVGGVKFHDTPRDCLVPSRATCPVHVYADAKSTLSQIGGAKFTTSQQGRDSYAAPGRALAPVHAYSSPSTTLRTAGGVAFGSTAPRADLFTSMSRTGLLTATATPRRTVLPRPQRVPKTLPKLELPTQIADAPKRIEEEVKGEDGGSPREVEATLGMLGA